MPARSSGMNAKIDDTARTFTIWDTGVGMTHDELVQHLGPTAKSGSLDFLQNASEFQLHLFGGGQGRGVHENLRRHERFARLPLVLRRSGVPHLTIVETSDVPRRTKIDFHMKDDATEFGNLSTVKKAAQKFSSYIDFPFPCSTTESPSASTSRRRSG